MKKFKPVIAAFIFVVLCCPLIACSGGNKLTTSKAGDISEIILTMDSGTKITLANPDTIKVLVNGFRGVEMTKHNHVSDGIRLVASVNPTAYLLVTVKMVYKTAKAISIGTQSSDSEFFSIYEDNSVFKSGISNSTLVGYIGEDLRDTITGFIES